METKGPLYYVIVYDVEQERVGKVLKLLRRYLNWVQNSVLEGELSDSQLERMVHELKRVIKPEKDAIVIYGMREKWLTRRIIGREKGQIGQIL